VTDVAHSFTLHPVDRPRQEANKLFLCRIYPVGSGYPDPPYVALNYPDPVGNNTSGTPLVVGHHVAVCDLLYFL